MLTAALEKMIVSPEEQRERAKALKRKFLPASKPATPARVESRFLPALKPPTIVRYQLSYSTAPDAWRLVGHGPRMPQAPKVSDIVGVVSRFYDVPINLILGSRNAASVALVRHIAIYLASELVGASHTEIGRRIGGRDHSTIRSAIRRIKRLLRSDEELRNDINKLRAQLLGQSPCA